MIKASPTDLQIDSGAISGYTYNGVRRWRGIPYAAAPIGALRFRAPQPVEAWTGTRQATHFGKASVQSRFGTRLGVNRYQQMSEDCLTINVSAPERPSIAPRPVMVFVHGGGFIFGTSALPLYDGHRMCTRGDVIYVSFNYRLGALGVLDLSEFSTPAARFETNLSLRDAVAALQWVQRNISVFGGDPDNVTIFGQSAGATAVLALMSAPTARGLFHRGIAQSPFGDLALSQVDTHEFSRRVVGRLGWSAANIAAQSISAEVDEIRIAYATEYRAAQRENPGWHASQPVVDRDFLPVHPIEALGDPNAPQVPLIVGTLPDEGTLFDQFMDSLPTTSGRLSRALTSEDFARVRDFYAPHDSPEEFVRAGGDYTFFRSTMTAAQAHCAVAPTFVYRYDFAPQWLKVRGLGATHASDLLATFGYGDTGLGRMITSIGGRSALRALTESMQHQWFTFARTGRPTDSWEPFGPNEYRTLIFDEPVRMESNPDRDRRTVWRDIAQPRLVRD